MVSDGLAAAPRFRSSTELVVSRALDGAEGSRRGAPVGAQRFPRVTQRERTPRSTKNRSARIR
jgi:hypothetical protein